MCTTSNSCCCSERKSGLPLLIRPVLPFDVSRGIFRFFRFCHSRALACHPFHKNSHLQQCGSIDPPIEYSSSIPVTGRAIICAWICRAEIMVVMCLFTFFVEKPQQFHVDSAEKADRHVYKGKLYICVQGKDNPAPICPSSRELASFDRRLNRQSFFSFPSFAASH